MMNFYMKDRRFWGYFLKGMFSLFGVIFCCSVVRIMPELYSYLQLGKTTPAFTVGYLAGFNLVFFIFFGYYFFRAILELVFSRKKKD